MLKTKITFIFYIFISLFYAIDEVGASDAEHDLDEHYTILMEQPANSTDQILKSRYLNVIEPLTQLSNKSLMKAWNSFQNNQTNKVQPLINVEVDVSLSDCLKPSRVGTSLICDLIILSTTNKSYIEQSPLLWVYEPYLALNVKIDLGHNHEFHPNKRDFIIVTKARALYSIGKYEESYNLISSYLRERIQFFERFKKAQYTKKVKKSVIPVDPSLDQTVLLLIEKLTNQKSINQFKRQNILNQLFLLVQHASPIFESAQMIDEVVLLHGGLTTAKLIKEKRALESEANNLNDKLVLSLLDPEVNQNIRIKMNERLKWIDTRIKAITAEFDKIKTRDGDTAIFTQTVEIKNLQEIMDTDEAILYYFNDKWLGSKFIGDYSDYKEPEILSCLLITKQQVRFVRLPLFMTETVRLIKQLRDSLDLKFTPITGDLPIYDFRAAKTLYEILIAPFDDLLATKKTITTITEGAMLSLPFSALVTEIPPGFDDWDFKYKFKYNNAKYLVKRFSFRSLPNISSFISLAITPSTPKPLFSSFLGIGNPNLNGPAKNPLTGRAFKAPYSSSYKSVYELVKQLPKLPLTAQELVDMSLFFPDKYKTILLGEQASEEEIFELNLKGKLKHFSFIAFATHGVLSEEISGFRKPALVLTPFANISKADGLLTPDEIVHLNLSAEILYLAACNTAGSDGKPDAQPLSGLAAAFFYAGAKRLMVTHWTIPSKETVQFTSYFMTYLKQKKSVLNSLNQAKIQMINTTTDSKELYAHPVFWAAFELVGAR